MTHHIVIVGGGAGGLELATRLGDQLGRSKRAHITLVDRSHTHVWKPLLHEVAAGSMDIHAHQLDYLAQAHWHHFTFCLGAMIGLQREHKVVRVAPIVDDRGEEILPQRLIPYDSLVIAIGSEANDFGVPGVAEYAYALDSPEEADRFHRRLVNACLRADAHPEAAGEALRVVIVGGGATGVELAAELHNTTRILTAYGLDNIDPETYLQLTLLNADARLLPMLPERIAKATTEILLNLRINVLCSELAVAVRPDSVLTKSGQSIPADLVVWAAGVKAPVFLAALDGLEINKLNQLVVTSTLQTTRDADIFALGDCAAFPRPGGKWLPPLAQAAHQQASHLARNLVRRCQGQALQNFQYRDFGSLVTLGEYSTIGSLMGFISGGSIRVEGWFARIMYISLYKLHQIALHGYWRVILDTLARMLKRRTEPRVKLH